MTNKIITPERDNAVKLHLITHHDVNIAYQLEDNIRELKNEYRGMLPQELHNFIHRHNHFPENSIEHEHDAECLEAYAQAAFSKSRELRELANN